MPSESQPNENWLREALAPSKDCLSIEDLGNYLEQKGDKKWRATVESHVAGCAYCGTELSLLREFQSEEVRPEEAGAVRAVTEELDRRSPEIFRRPESALSPRPWWKDVLAPRWLIPAVAALAGILVMIGVDMQLRQSAVPALQTGDRGQDVLRSSTLTVTAPIGDLREAPTEVAWQAVAGAVKYQVRLLEVDRTELWQVETSATRVALPAAVRDRIVPAKTILCQVTAFDAGGAKIAESETVRFRIAPNIH